MSDRHLDSIVKPFPRPSRSRERVRALPMPSQINGRDEVAALAVLIGSSAFFSSTLFLLVVWWMTNSMVSG